MRSILCPSMILLSLILKKVTLLLNNIESINKYNTKEKEGKTKEKVQGNIIK